MVEYLSTLGAKTVNTTRSNMNVVSLLRRFKLPLLIVTAVILLVLIGVWAQSGIGSTPTADINQNFTISARTEDKVRVRDANLSVNLTNADIDNSLLVQGKRATTREGKTFLIINMEVENSYEVPLYIFPVDLLRLVREDGKRVAPSVHQGTVEIRPISLKKSNVGFVVDPNEKDFKIEIGELSGDKQLLDISFK